MRCFLFLFSFFSLTVLSAQNVQLNEDPRISALVRNWTSNNRSTPHVEGWRVQIMASTDRMQVDNGRTRFRTEHPDVAADWVLEKPFYKLRVGAFRTKQEALAFISELEGWAGAYPMRDSAIHPRDFLEQ